MRKAYYLADLSAESVEYTAASLAHGDHEVASCPSISRDQNAGGAGLELHDGLLRRRVADLRQLLSS